MYSSTTDPSAGSLESSALSDDDASADPARIFSRAESEALFRRIVGLTTGGGDTSVSIRMQWVGNLRWAQNDATTSAVVRRCRVVIQRLVNNALVKTETSKLDDASLKKAIGEAEQRLEGMRPRSRRSSNQIALPPAQQYLNAPIWSDATFKVAPKGRSDAAWGGVAPVIEAKMLAAGYLETRAVSWAIFNTQGLAAYAAGTAAQYSETVRNLEGTGSGWSALSHTDWSKLNVSRLSTRALQKCVTSANPKAIEPGRYTTILEPQAVAEFMNFAISNLDRERAEAGEGPYAGKTRGTTKIGEKILDERITISTDPMDPDCCYIPFDGEGYPYRPVTWIEKGVLKELSYDSAYARRRLKTDVPLLNPDAFRMSGGETSIEEMIATTQRGLLVTRFNGEREEDNKSVFLSTVTRDGVWLIENGKIKYPVKNMRVFESPLFIGNTVEQLGKPERVSGSYWLQRGNTDLDNYPSMALSGIPHVVPPLKVRDFNFISLSDAV